MVIGIFSVMAYAVSLRTHEIGVCMALGAQEDSVLRLVLIAGFRLVAAGIFIGFTISYTLTRFLANLVSGASAVDPWIFCAVIALVMFAGLLACLIPARRATKVAPLVALRYDD